MILHRQGTQPRLMDSSEHSSLSINLNLRKRNSIVVVVVKHIGHFKTLGKPPHSERECTFRRLNNEQGCAFAA